MADTDVAIVVGHHPDAQGATLELEGQSVTEYELWREFARELCLTMEGGHLTPHYVERPHPKPDEALGRRVNATGATCAVELHFNAVASGGPRGTKMLHYPGSKGGELLASILQRTTLNGLGLENRGTEPRANLGFLRHTSMPSVIVEPAFGSNQADGFKLLSRLPELMEAYRAGLIEYVDSEVVS